MARPWRSIPDGPRAPGLCGGRICYAESRGAEALGALVVYCGTCRTWHRDYTGRLRATVAELADHHAVQLGEAG